MVIRCVRYQVHAGNNLPQDAGAAESHSQIVASIAFFVQGHDVVGPTGCQGFRSRLLRSVFGPLAGIGPGVGAFNICDFDGIGRIFVRTEPELAVVIAGDPERITPRYRRY